MAVSYVLIIAQSGRMLAALAKQADENTLVIDLFADEDTLALANHYSQVATLVLDTIKPLLMRLKEQFNIIKVVYGSGLEQYPETLAYLQHNFKVCGCDVMDIDFQGLDALNINYPAVSFYYPDEPEKWLIKSFQSAGGMGVSGCDRKIVLGEYYQRFCAGILGSALFVANGKDVQIIGFHRQWSVSDTDFRFAGIIQYQGYPEQLQALVYAWLIELVAYYDIQGLGSLDFIVNGERCYFLELNLRPPASAMLYPELPLWQIHTESLVDFIVPEIDEISAMQVMYATQDYAIGELQWPDWCVDRPQKQSNIKKNEPLCSIMASEISVKSTLACLSQRQAVIENNINLGR